MAKIFISYKRQDKDKVLPIIEEIKQKTGVDCWIDLEGIESGDQFQNVIIDAIEKADIVIFMLSKNFIAPYKDEKTGKADYKNQTFPEKEVMYALRHNKRLVPISIDGTTVYNCKWLEFNCSGLDCINWKNDLQRKKLFRDIIEKRKNYSVKNYEKKGNNISLVEKKKWRKWNKRILFVTISLMLFIGFSLTNSSPLVFHRYNTIKKRIKNNIKYKSIHIISSGTLYGTYEAIDLGLSIKWSSKFINSSKQCGDAFFSWGEIDEKDVYLLNNYKYFKDGVFQKYSNNKDSLYTLHQKDDIAAIICQHGWRIPTYEECRELYDKCKKEFVLYNGTLGLQLTGPNNNTLFLPLNGEIEDNNRVGENSYVCFWASSLCTDDNKAHEFAYSIANNCWFEGERCLGKNVLPVHK